MKRKRGAAVCCALLLGLTGCALVSARESAPPEDAWCVYYSAMDNEGATAAVDCAYSTVPAGTADVSTLMRALLTPPEEETGMTSPFPAGVRLLDWALEDGQLHLDLSEQYGGLSGVDLTVADYCIALTFCQLPGVESVYITVEGHEIPYRHSQRLTASDVLLSGAEEEPVYVGVSLYYPRAGGGGVEAEYRQVLKPEGGTLAEAVLSAWLEGPQTEELAPCPPEGTQVRAVKVEEGACTVDLSAAFLENAPADQAQAGLVLDALANTLGGLEHVGSVRILVEGAPLYTAVGAQLWYPRADGAGVEAEFRQVLRAEGGALAEAVLYAWLAGPEHAELAPCLPRGTRVRSVALEDGVCTLDLSAEFVRNAPADRTQAGQMLQALVNTLGGLEGAGSVRILAEGESIPALGGFRLDQPLKPGQEPAPEGA